VEEGLDMKRSVASEHSDDVSNIDCTPKVRARTYGLANGLSLRFRVSESFQQRYDPQGLLLTILF
jgi:hypothetical protein